MSEFFKFNLGTNLRFTLLGAPQRRLGGGTSNVQKNDSGRE